MIVKTYSSYRANLRNGARALWSGEWDYLYFYDQMMLAVQRGFTQAWQEGMASLGIAPDEMTAEEQIRLRQEINGEYSFIDRLASFIERNSKANGGKLSVIFSRVDMWAGAYTSIMNLAKTYAQRDPKLKWVIDFPKESCSSCKKLNGKIKRASYWRERNIYPKSWDVLFCRGGCKCSFVETTEPLSRGPLPNLP